MTTPITLAAEGYDELAIILRDAFEQASRGKGAERHANDLPFDQQPMQSISSLFDSDKGMAFQVVKKLREGLDMPEYERLERELLGSIVYTAGIILWHKRRHTAENARLVAAVEPPKTFAETCAEIDKEVVRAVEAINEKLSNPEALYPDEPPVVSLCPYCGAGEGVSHKSGCPMVTTPDSGPPTATLHPNVWVAGEVVECVRYYPDFTIGEQYRVVEVDHKGAKTVKIFGNENHIHTFGYFAADLYFATRPAK
jgi:hypothetical protein